MKISLLIVIFLSVIQIMLKSQINPFTVQVEHQSGIEVGEASDRKLPRAQYSRPYLWGAIEAELTGGKANFRHKKSRLRDYFLCLLFFNATLNGARGRT